MMTERWVREREKQTNKNRTRVEEFNYSVPFVLFRRLSACCCCFILFIFSVCTQGQITFFIAWASASILECKRFSAFNHHNNLLIVCDEMTLFFIQNYFIILKMFSQLFFFFLRSVCDVGDSMRPNDCFIIQKINFKAIR